MVYNSLIKEAVQNVSVKYKNINHLNEWWIDRLAEQDILPESTFNAATLPSYWLSDYKKLYHLDRLSVLRDVACDDVYKVEQAAAYFQYYMPFLDTYCKTFDNIMTNNTPEYLIPDNIDHDKFYDHETDMCYRLCAQTDHFKTLSVTIYWSWIQEWYDKNPGHHLINFDPPWNCYHISFSLDEVWNAITYAKNNGHIKQKVKRIKRFLFNMRNRDGDKPVFMQDLSISWPRHLTWDEKSNCRIDNLLL